METQTEPWWLPMQAPVRPFRNVSDYVLETMPGIISSMDVFDEEARGCPQSLRLYDDIDRLFSGVTPEEIASMVHSSQMRVCSLDLKMCMMALWHTGNELPESMRPVVEAFVTATGDAGILTYEDIVLSNPSGDMRTFFDKGGIGMSEAFFYRMHQLIEDQLVPVSDTIRQALEARSVDGPALESVASGFREVNRLNALLGRKLDKAEFGVFRRLLSSTHGMKGSSGAFSGTFPLIDLMWLGGAGVFSGNLTRYLEDNAYFPSFQRAEMLRLATGACPTIVESKEAGIPGFGELNGIVKDGMDRFFAAHMGSVRHHLPGVFNNSEQGTMGGESPTGTYLEDSLKHRKDQ